jgi:probable addiction module antidote protein
MTKNTLHTNYSDWLLEELQDPKLALAYLNEALKDEDQRVFLLALKNVLEAQGGDMSAIAEEANLNRQNLYRMLSTKGNPRWDSLTSLFNVLGLQVHLSQKK